MSKNKRDEQQELFMKKRHTILCRCKCCNHGLSDPESVAREMGPSCWEKGGGERFQIMMNLEDCK